MPYLTFSQSFVFFIDFVLIMLTGGHSTDKSLGSPAVQISEPCFTVTSFAICASPI